MVADRRVSDKQLLGHFLTRALVFVTVPVTLYLSCFYVHLSLLYKAGPNDNVMTSQFQASLEVRPNVCYFSYILLIFWKKNAAVSSWLGDYRSCLCS